MILGAKEALWGGKDQKGRAPDQAREQVVRTKERKSYEYLFCSSFRLQSSAFCLQSTFKTVLDKIIAHDPLEVPAFIQWLGENVLYPGLPPFSCPSHISSALCR
jgi:hypothetical protein